MRVRAEEKPLLGQCTLVAPEGLNWKHNWGCSAIHDVSEEDIIVFGQDVVFAGQWVEPLEDRLRLSPKCVGVDRPDCKVFLCILDCRKERGHVG